MIRATVQYPWSALLGGLIAMFVIFMSGPLFTLGRAAYDELVPVATNWRVLDWRTEGDDIVLSGLMTKQRECVYVPPPMARDELGQNYELVNLSPANGGTWAVSGHPQKWGPWRVAGGAGKRLTFHILYSCGSEVSISDLGTFKAPR
mgnify:FL=1